MAKSEDHIEWITSLDTADIDFVQFLLKEFLINSPALEVSARSEGWITRFGINDSDDAETLFGSLTDKLRCFTSDKQRFAANSDEVERLLNKYRCLSGPFWNENPFIVYTILNDVRKQVDIAITNSTEKNSVLKESKKKLVKAKYQQVDALFRHIRNALAHGSFQPKLIDSRHRVCIFQDSSTSGDLSARMVIGEETLRHWAAQFAVYEANGV